MYIVYKTTNIINGKFYIGVHDLNGIKKRYLGSGKLLKRSIKKYGRNNFIRETIQEFELEHDAYDYEKDLVNNDLINNPLCYNLVEGGGNPPTFYGEYHYTRKHNIKFYGKDNPFYGKKHSEKSIKLMREIKLGKKTSKETRIKQSLAQKGIKKPKSISHILNTTGINNSRSLNWNINNKIFYSSREAATFYNVTHKTIMNWCKSSKKPDCFCSSKGEI